MMPCTCATKRTPEPICCCYWPPKQNGCGNSNAQSFDKLPTCQSFKAECACNKYFCYPSVPPLRMMQKALVDKWTELDKLSQLAQMYWCQQRALQHQLTCLQAKYCNLQRMPEVEPKESCCLMNQERPRVDMNEVSRYRSPEDPSVYTGVLKLRQNESGPNQLCICNNQEPETTFRGTVKIHDQEERREPLYRPAPCRCENYMESERIKTESAMKELNYRLANANKNEQDANERLQRIRGELATLQTRIKSNWGHNVLDKCTPAKENQMKFF